MKPPALIPDDFPRHTRLGALPGLQPKVLARLIGGSYVSGIDEEEVLARYQACEQLAHQLIAYLARKQLEMPTASAKLLVARVVASVRRKSFGWGLAPIETEWLLRRFHELRLVKESEDE